MVCHFLFVNDPVSIHGAKGYSFPFLFKLAISCTEKKNIIVV